MVGNWCGGVLTNGSFWPTTQVKRFLGAFSRIENGGPVVLNPGPTYVGGII